MVEAIGAEQVLPPVIIGAAGDIGRTVLQQLLDDEIVPAGIVLTAHRLADLSSRAATAEQIASNFVPGGEARFLDDVVLLRTPTLKVGSVEIPVFTPESQHEIFQAGHPVIDATGKNKNDTKLQPMLEEGASFVLVTCPIHEKEGIPAVVYGVNGTDERFAQAAERRLLSTSSCTTTAVSSLLGPILASKELNPPDDPKILAAFVDVDHARTKSNSRENIADNFMLSPSGAVQEIPKILGLDGDEPAFNLECCRADVNVGSKANLTLVFGPNSPAGNPVNLKRDIIIALKNSDSVYELDPQIEDTKGVVGRRESVVVNLREVKASRLRNGGAMATAIYAFYDNVHGYTRSALDSYRAMSSLFEP